MGAERPGGGGRSRAAPQHPDPAAGRQPGTSRRSRKCRQRFPDLRILSGVEAGEAHLFAASAGAVVGGHRFDRILGSLHAVPLRGRLVGLPAMYGMFGPDEVLRRYFAELLRLVTGSDLFQVLAHLDFPRRYWPASSGPYEEKEFEEEYRTVLRALAQSDRALEMNTKSPLASVQLLGWWRDEGGRAVSFGSDSHQDWRVGDRFAVAVDIAEAAGFRAGTGPLRLLAALTRRR